MAKTKAKREKPYRPKTGQCPISRALASCDAMEAIYRLRTDMGLQVFMWQDEDRIQLDKDTCLTHLLAALS